MTLEVHRRGSEQHPQRTQWARDKTRVRHSSRTHSYVETLVYQVDNDRSK
jgi:hypothetical protein